MRLHIRAGQSADGMPGWPSSTGIRLLTIEVHRPDMKLNFEHLTAPAARMATNASVT